MGDRWRGAGFGGANVLTGLCHVSKVCFPGIRTVAIDKFGSESRSRGVGPMADGGKPDRLNRVSGCGMKVCNESWSAGEIIGTGSSKEVVRCGGLW